MTRRISLLFSLTLLLNAPLASAGLPKVAALTKFDPQFLKRGCIATLRFTVDPLDQIYRTGQKFFAKDWAEVFDDAKYRQFRERYESEPERLRDEPLSAEQFLARSDVLFDRVGYADRVHAKTRFPDNIDSRLYIDQVRSILKKKEKLGPADLRQLARLYYGITRNIPYYPAETLLRLPKKSKFDFIDYQVENLFLRMAFADVLKDFGIHSQLEMEGAHRGMKRAMYASLMGAIKALGWTNGELGLGRLTASPELWEDVLAMGYEAALKKRTSFFQNQVSRSANIEVFFGIAGGLFSIYGAIELGYRMIAEEGPVEPGFFGENVPDEDDAPTE